MTTALAPAKCVSCQSTNMSPSSLPTDTPTDLTPAVPALVGEVFQASPLEERRRLLEYLLPPLGVLALVTVANGVFASIRFRGVLEDGHIPVEEAARIQASDVVALVDRLQMVSVEAMDGLVHLVAASPSLASTAAGALLLAALSIRIQKTKKTPQALR